MFASSSDLIPANVSRSSVVETPVDRDDLHIWELFRRRARWFLYGGVLGGAAGCLYGVFCPTYVVNAELVVIRKSPNLPARAATTTTDVESDVTSNLLSTHVEILKSPRIVQAGLRRHGLESLESIEKKRYSYESPTDYVIREMKVVHGGVESVDASANIVRATFKHPSAEDSQKILSAVVESYVSFVAATFQDVSSEAVGLIEQAKSDVEIDLKRAESEYIEFLQEAPLYWSGELSANGDKNASIPQRRLEKVEEKLADVRLRYIETRTKLDVIEQALAAAPAGSGNGEYALAMLDGQALQRLNFFADIVRGDPSRSESFQVEQSLRQQAIRAEYEKQLGLLLEEEAVGLKYGKNHWRSQELVRQKAAIDEFLTKHTPQANRDLKDSVPSGDVLAAYVQMLRNDAVDLKKRQDEFEELSRADIASAKEIVNFEVRGELLRQELDRKRRLHELVIDRLREMNLMKEYGGVVTEVIGPVEKGKLKWLGLIDVSPWVGVLLSVIAGGFVGTSMGIVLGTFRHLTDNTFGCDDDIQRALGLPLLGHVDQDDMLSQEKSEGAVPGIQSAITVYNSPDSVSAEAYRQTRNALLLLRSCREFKVLQISAATPGDDQAFLAANLAAAYAQDGQNTLLVDCDLRNRTVSRLWGMAEQAGLSECIRKEVDWRQQITTSIPGLSVLAAGQLKNGASDTTFSANFRGMINAAKAEFDTIILVSPEILGRSESLAIAVHSDVVLLCLRAARGKRGAALLARDSLIKFGVSVAGVVVTGADDKSFFGYRDLRRALRRLLDGTPAGRTGRG
jgi:capsular exopolysaccharide synthesis family protein